MPRNKIKNPTSIFQPGAVLHHRKSKNSQAHPPVSPLNPITHRNTSFQPLPRPIGLPPYRYDLASHFPTIHSNITDEKKLVFHVLGDSGGVKDGEFQNNVAEQMIGQLSADGKTGPQFVTTWAMSSTSPACTTNITLNSTSLMPTTTLPFLPSPAITMAKSMIQTHRPLLTVGWTTSCRPPLMSIPSPRMRRVLN